MCCRIVIVLAVYCLCTTSVMAQGLRGVGWKWGATVDEIKQIEQGRLVFDWVSSEDPTFRKLVYEIEAFGENMDATYSFTDSSLYRVEFNCSFYLDTSPTFDRSPTFAGTQNITRTMHIYGRAKDRLFDIHHQALLEVDTKYEDDVLGRKQTYLYETETTRYKFTLMYPKRGRRMSGGLPLRPSFGTTSAFVLIESIGQAGKAP